MPSPPRAKVLHLERSLLYHFAGITDRVGGSMHMLCRDRYGLSPAAWRVMAHVGELQPITAKEIGLRAAMDSVNLSRAMGQLDALGFLKRHIDPADRRRIVLQLTPAGQSAYDTLVPLSLEAERTLLAELNAQERATLRELAHRVWERSRRLFDDTDQETSF
ncbi:MarR family winged helix-turn-helix transcriptional regulator [Hydrogenophaga sp.]|jgi:DNA-binding MarR family transcriptional regulator|uniref:MarR family winged helix-turn-helix transcriptional regulator n=1 Tax=Hydrogenophaga sp. TaxID=1904254 RepID=UPI000A2D2257|nr:hypothetical protein CAP37_09620 [Hydrogenophaga sp. IBVHS1]